MPTIKLQNSKVVTKNGKVSCECCSVECPVQVNPWNFETVAVNGVLRPWDRPSTIDVRLGTGLGFVTFVYDGGNPLGLEITKERFRVVFEGQTIIDTGFIEGENFVVWEKSTTTPTATVIVDATVIVGSSFFSTWGWSMSCPQLAP